MPESREPVSSTESAAPEGDGADAGGMVDLATFEALEAESGDRAPEPEADPDALPTISEERRRELKEQARRMIEERLRSRRKQRRLMRGGNL